MEPIVACALDPDSGDHGPVEFARVAAMLLGARMLTVVVRPGGSASERLARMEPGRDAEAEDAGGRAASGSGSRRERRRRGAPRSQSRARS
jgi:hypothetical protein